ncbi:hypothetical protein G7Y79_00076g099290 [Physcia stellaris]|nr:hypothetical protein G7Y79_00076g099290 [Physcia stellaris]
MHTVRILAALCFAATAAAQGNAEISSSTFITSTLPSTTSSPAPHQQQRSYGSLRPPHLHHSSPQPTTPTCPPVPTITVTLAPTPLSTATVYYYDIPTSNLDLAEL